MLACLSYAENIVECYDFESGQWILLTERPVDVPHYGSEAVTACGSKFYAVGGLQSRSKQRSTVYTINDNDLKSLVTMRMFAGTLIAMTRRPTLGPLASPCATTELLIVSSTAHAAQNQEDHQEKARSS